MIKQLIATFIIILAPAFAVSQNYRPLPGAGAAWQFVNFVQPTQYYYFSDYFFLKTPDINADTLINSNTYYKLYKNSLTYNFSEYEGCYRSDSTGKTWWIPRNDSAEYLLMDLNVNPGDTVNNIYLQANLPAPVLINIVVDSVGWHVSGNKVLKKVYGSDQPFSSDRILWIEELGSMMGFFNYGVNLLPYNYYQPICVSFNDTAWYYQTDTAVFENSALTLPDTMQPIDGSCSLFIATIVGVEDRLLVELNFYPNPASTSLTIEPTTNEPQQFRITNASGQLVLSQNIQGRTAVDVSHLPEGLYIAELETPQGIVHQKLVLQR
jgi:hypothetical protein